MAFYEGAYVPNPSLSRRLVGVERLGVWIMLLCSAGMVSASVATAAVVATEPEPVLDAVPDGAYDEARVLLNKKKWAEGLVVLKRSLKSSVAPYPLVLEMARALVYTNRREEALSILAQSAAKETGRRKETVIRRIKILSRLFLTNVTFQAYQEGMNLLLGKKFRLARERFERAQDQEPDNVEILLRIGQCLLIEGDADSAAERLRLAKKLNAHEPQIRLWLGRALYQRGEIVDAIRELKLAKASLKTSELASVWLAEALSGSGQRPAGILLLEEDLKEQPFHLQALLTLARLRFWQGTRDRQILWAVRKDLQLAMSRLDRYTAADVPSFEGELGVDLRDSAKIREETDALLQRVDSSLEDHRGRE